MYLGGCAPIVISYLGAVYAYLLFFFFVSYKKQSVSDISSSNVFKVKTTFLFFFIQALLVVYIQVIPWAIDTFPLSNIEAVLFTLFAGTKEGAEEFVISSFLDRAVFPAIKIFTVILAFHWIVALIKKNESV